MPDGEKRVTVHLSVAPWVAELLRGIRKPGRVVDNLVESAKKPEKEINRKINTFTNEKQD